MAAPYPPSVQVFANNFESTLAAPFTSGDTRILLSSDEYTRLKGAGLAAASLVVDLGDPDQTYHFYMTLATSADAQLAIARCTGFDDGSEGIICDSLIFSGDPFPANAKVQLRLTAESLADLREEMVSTSGFRRGSSSLSADAFDFEMIGNLVQCNGTFTLTLPDISALGFVSHEPNGASIDFFLASAGAVTFAPDSGVTLRAPGGNYKLDTLYGQCTATFIPGGGGTWILKSTVALSP